VLRASETGILDREELDDARRSMSAESYASEFECDPYAAILGAYYGKELNDLEGAGRITEVLPERGIPVHTAWDLGIGDSTAIWFWQAIGSEVRIIDNYENHGHGLPHYVGVLNARGYDYGHDFVPHDARVRELGTGKTRVETLASLGRKPRLVPGHKVEDGINAARLMLKQAWFDAERCRDGIEALRQYRTEFDDKTRAFKNTPRHDWTSHQADALRYLAMAWQEMRGVEVEKPKPLYKPLHELTMDEYIDWGARAARRERA
jgi:hypothetical protein